MDKVLKRVTHHKKQSINSTAKARDDNDQVPTSSINKRYSVDDNFYTYVNRNDLRDNCNGSTYYTISNRGDFKRNQIHRAKFNMKQESGEKQIAREDAAFKKFLRVFNTGENSRGAKDWLANSANNMMDLAPKIFTKRFHGKKGRENELYRSNSFKFERFERTDSDTLNSGRKSPGSKQISLCDDYSLPVDFVNKRPLSLDSGSFWSATSPNGDQVEVLNLYCDPKDSAKGQQETVPDDLNADEEVPSNVLEEKLKLYSVVHKEPKDYCRPYKESSDDGEREDDEAELYENLKHRKSLTRSAHKGSTYTEVRKSPYYYGDLLKRCQSEDKPTRGGSGTSNSYRKCQSLDVVRNSSGYETHSAKEHQYENTSVNNSFDIQEEDEEDEDMANKQRHMYETAFDSKICRSNETLDVDVVANHVMERYSPQLPYNPAFCANVSKDNNKCSLKRLKNAKNKLNSSHKYDLSVDNISQHLTDLDINNQSTLLHGYSSASTSTIPLPQSVSSNINDSCESFSESSHPGSKVHSESLIQEIQKAIKNNSPIYANNIVNNNNNNDDVHSNRSKSTKNMKNMNNYRYQDHRKHKPVFCYRNGDCCASDSTNDSSRPKSCQLNAKILEIKSRPREERTSHPRRFSSTESMATSSSGGSLESIRSSTSEGNRSTTSTDSRHSSSLSSHSSDSAVGNGSYFPTNFQLGNRFLNHNKMHVLSPISDKSFQEAGSESSEVNRNSNSQIVSPEDGGKTVSPDSLQSRPKRRTPPNKNVGNLRIPFASTKDVEAHQCSDSGISMESRSDTTKMSSQITDLAELPFDMPKLRRRRLQQMQLTQSTQDTSSSATSIDLKDLPFDMPKLRRKLRSSSTQESTELPLDANIPDMSEETLDEPAEESNKQSPVLDLGKNRRSLGLSLNLSEIIPPGFNIDAALPLERQGWYHGAITRMEAENELRNREEGSYLVRNSESAKNDYSLSLKSAKGFMHMRIQKSGDVNKFILGQFSSPFNSIPEMIKHYSSNQLPIRGAEHMCLLQPVIVQLL